MLCGQKGGGLGRQAALLGQLLALGNALGGFFIQQLGYGGWPTHAAEAAHDDFLGNIALAQCNGVAGANLTRGLGIGLVDGDAALANFFHGQAAGFVEPRTPQPFVQTHGFNFTHGAILRSG